MPSQRAFSNPQLIVVTTAAITASAVNQPSPAIYSAVIRAPSKLTRMRNACREQRWIPGLVRESSLG